ncbi:hypothetical protein C8F04DRAFT_1238219 [Mycena alexandri]|uniref:Uncharacterized protein n=1 Tax=Mycena alexandri TaxID=1745969 RepID=A0AAD6WXM2_9AGAR|nr:hypothetical protein C8F04DRAFT_1238219 [Mycena alexandri]
MPVSDRKDRVTYIAVREFPPHLSNERLGPLRIFQTPLLSANLRAVGYPESRPRVLSVAEFEARGDSTSPDHWAEVSHALVGFLPILSSQGSLLKERGLGSARPFFAGVTTKINSPAAAVAFLPFSTLLHGFLSNNAFRSSMN